MVINNGKISKHEEKAKQGGEGSDYRGSVTLGV
jgi:hypothetical protein